ncbi:MAG: 3-isopropylmalate dehydrogenase [Actinomycetaceae bacterium]|nr:3-isopropylmalate dehydrogenase [Actinomycetaceae bacterium]
MAKQINLAIIPGDGIGPEVTDAALEVLRTVAAKNDLEINEDVADLGAQRYLRDGQVLPEEEFDRLKKADAILLGAIGDPRVPSGVLERGLLLALRFGLDHYVNLRPGKLLPSVESPLKNPGEIDLVVVREGTEGLYCGNGGNLRAGTDAEIATETSVNTAYGVRRVVEYAFELAQKRRRHLTLVHKHNVLVNAGGMWQRIVSEVGQKYPEVSVDYNHIDAATIYLVTDPARYDVIVTDNLFGDILTDEIGAVTGGIGLAPSANLNPAGAFPSMFEPVHGSAPDIAGKGVADPVAAISTVALLLDHLGHEQAAEQVRAAVLAHMQRRAAGEVNWDQTKAVTADVCAQL